MNSYTTRVELHYANERDYQNLHQAMERAGFSRVIQGSNGLWYHLPPAEYDRSTYLTIDQVRESASQAAVSTGKTSSVLVSQATARSWIGLGIATAPANR